jgi:hypothetical protein
MDPDNSAIEATRAAAMPLTALRSLCRLMPLLLAACGGGGGDSGGSGELYEPQRAWTTLLTQPSAWTTRGVASNGQNWELAVSFAPGANAPSPVTGDLMRPTTQTTVFTVDGATPGTAAITSYVGGDGLLQGDLDDTGQCGFAVFNAPVPETAFVGQSGQFATLRDLLDCNRTTAWNGLRQFDWSLETEGAIVFFCVKTSLISASGSPLLGVSNECYETTATGSLGPRARVELRIVQPPFELVTRNY